MKFDPKYIIRDFYQKMYASKFDKTKFFKENLKNIKALFAYKYDGNIPDPEIAMFLNLCSLLDGKGLYCKKIQDADRISLIIHKNIIMIRGETEYTKIPNTFFAVVEDEDDGKKSLKLDARILKALNKLK